MRIFSTRACQALVCAMCVLSAPGLASAQTPLGKWWAQDAIRRELALTDAQSREIERLFQSVLPQLHSALEEVHREEAILSRLLDDRTRSEAELERAVDNQESARRELGIIRSTLRFRTRRILTAPQRATLERIRARLDGAP